MKNVGFVLLGICILPGLFFSCSTSTGETNKSPANIYGGSSQALLFLSCKAVSEREIDFEFSLPVRVVSLRFTPNLEIDSIEEGSTVKVNITDNPGPGVKFLADILAEDTDGNTISVLAPFRSRNDRMPLLRINELRTEYSKPRTEFIEFKMLSSGNLGAMRVFVESNSKNPLIYEFAPVEISEGEYVVLHLRTLEDSCRDEYAALDESGGTDSSPTARDFWIPGAVKLLRKTDAVYVLDQDDRALGAVMISENPDSAWKKDYFDLAAEFLFMKRAWLSPAGRKCLPLDAVNSFNIKTSVTRSISRDETAENTNTSADWYITATSCATPGGPNNPKRF